MYRIYKILCLVHTPATSLQQCNGVGTIPVSRNEPYNVTCDITETTRNVTWTFLSLLTGDTDVVVNDCLLISPSRESSSCRSKVPYFTIHRPHYAYTSLEIVWDQLPDNKTYGKIMCSLDGRPPDSCYLVISVTAGEDSLGSMMTMMMMIMMRRRRRRIVVVVIIIMVVKLTLIGCESNESCFRYICLSV